ncbi:DNA-binding protein [Steroidobacter agaridevorans]|uniref:DNA-binding protein n=1 Tax=Steroidobacter agaridevorans TaxID=2695856 RepID=A0A829Y5V2_9GAMM|nr:DNA-binding protein [Steroidobacter agaridevorans]GFE78599.1 DNA-binding protein [Steroidobacter agaridevorans]GFE89468.1 DNA-binding protein [Steroidobacter agaridevorans]
MEYDFELRFKLADPGPVGDDVVERLGAAGCDDATVGVGLPGSVALMFTREASSAKQAIVSALEDVKRAIPDAELIEVSPDLVGLTDIAELVGVSRQNMRKLMIGHAATFPAPVHDGSTAVWRLAPVLEWLNGRSGYAIDKHLLDIARMAMQINLAKELRHLKQPVEKRISALVA